MDTTTAIRVLCVDDHELLADGLIARLSQERDFCCVGRLTRADVLVDEAKRLDADVVLLDLEMPGADPLERLPQLFRSHPDVKVIILSAHVRDGCIDASIQCGASGYFSKTDSPAEIIQGIRTVASGGEAYGREIQERMALTGGPHGNGRESKLRVLSPRELQVLRLIGRGMSRADIARQLCRSRKTIDAQHTSIMRKLDIHDRAELTRYAIREGLVEA